MFNIYLVDSGALTLLEGKLPGVRWNWVLNVYLNYLCSLSLKSFASLNFLSFILSGNNSNLEFNDAQPFKNSSIIYVYFLAELHVF